MDNKEFISYLKTVLQLEKNLYTLSTSLDKTTETVTGLMRRKTYKEPVETERSGSEIGYLLGGGFILLLAALMTFTGIAAMDGYGIFMIVLSLVPWGLGIGCVVYSRRMKNARVEHNANAWKKYTNAIETQEKRLDREAEYGKHLIAVSEKINSQLDDTSDALKKLYSINIIHPKYRNLIAIASFCEYFETGRCTQLEGHEGAYNIFENEARLDRIITNQEKILDALDQIKNNQYTLYCAIRESQYHIERISVKLDRVMSLSEQTAQNSAITAYNSKCTAENTAALNSYMLWKDVLR